MLFLIYALLAAAVIFLSIKAANYVDLLDKKTHLSGAFIGGVLLAAVTSLPELFTTISATLIVDNPSLGMGNILGSNLFNLAVIAVLILIASQGFSSSSVSNSHLYTTICTLGIYLTIILSLSLPIDIEILTISLVSIVITLFYVAGLKGMAEAPSEGSNEKDDSSLTVKQVVIRFILCSLALIITSIVVTYVADQIAITYNLGAGLVGAIFLGVATSLPELTSCIALVKVKNFNMAIGNIVGSNLFNFLILAFADLLYVPSSVYIFTDKGTLSLLIFGFVASLLMGFILFLKTTKNKFKQMTPVYVVCSFGIVLCYIAFLL
ncbi:cation transporter [Sporanaerobium hydrogeniformans]|uniref:Cation transporter n=1 Tax=Sporanaerobium hydrogeniformans TaxID=3072179 RepID=A0AC61DC77_9FIRM|nr:cation transporter [Sporanaerobium hydrogeniformans]PHV70217.1 cation transporter [Sporanaerobium hydrogeniformans]